MDFKNLPLTNYEYMMDIRAFGGKEDLIFIKMIERMIGKKTVKEMMSRKPNTEMVKDIMKNTDKEVFLDLDKTLDIIFRTANKIVLIDSKKIKYFDSLDIDSSEDYKQHNPLRTMLIRLYSILRIKSSMEPLFFITKNTAEAFFVSDSKIRFKDIKMPHSAFYMQVDRNILEVSDGIMDTDLVGIYVIQHKTKDGDEILLNVVGLISDSDSYSQSGSFYLSIKENIESGLPEISSLFDVDRMNLKNKINVSASEYIKNLVISTILYLTGQNRDTLVVNHPNDFIPVYEPPSKKQMSSIKEVCKKRIVVIGPRIENLGLIKSMRDDGTYVLTHRYLVGGHFRRQPYGPRDNPTYEIIWIAPFIRGPEGTEFVPRKTIVKAVKE